MRECVLPIDLRSYPSSQHALACTYSREKYVFVCVCVRAHYTYTNVPTIPEERFVITSHEA